MGKKGSILIIVLWALFILSALTMAISGYVRARLSAGDRLSQDARGHYLAKAGVRRAIFEARNNDITDKYDAAGDTWSDNDAVFKDAPLGDGTYSVLKESDGGRTGQSPSGTVPADSAVKYGLSDEEGKINVNKAPVIVLKNLLEIAGGVSPEDSGGIAASIVNWRNPPEKSLKEGADEFHYQALDRPYKARNAEMEVPEELLLVGGVTDGIFSKIRSRITIYGSGAVNINTAHETVLRSLGMSEELAKKIVHFRENPGEPSEEGEEEVPVFFDDTAKITAYLTKKESISAEESGRISNLISQGLLGISSDNFSATAVGRAGSAGAVKISFVFDRKSNLVKWWRE